MRLPRLILALLLSSAAALPTRAELPNGPLPDGLGVNIHFTDPRPGEMEQLAAAGFTWVRMDLNWGGIEREPGTYDFAAYDRLVSQLEKHHVKAIFILDYSNRLYDDDLSPHTDAGRAAFAKWAAATAKHFAGRGFLWEMYNEPNIQFWRPMPNVDDYAKLALAVGKAMREAVPNETYVGPATSGIDLKFIEACFKAGCLDYWSAVSVHPYRQTAPETAAREYRALRQLIARYAPPGKTVPILSGEWGYSSVWNRFDEAKQGKYLPRELLTNQWQGVPLSIWYDWHDDGTDPKEGEHHFGTVHNAYLKDRTPVYEPKPAYIAMHTLSEQLVGYRYDKRLSIEGRADDYVLLFKRDGQPADVKLVAWTVAKDPHEVTLPASAGAIAAVTYLGEKAGDLKAAEGGFKVALTDAPLYLTPRQPDATWARLAAAPAVPPDLIVPAGSPSPLPGVKVSRSPVPQVVRVPFENVGAPYLAQETAVVSADPLYVTLLPFAGGGLSVRIAGSQADGLKGNVSLTGIEGLEVEETTQRFELQPLQLDTTVRFAAKADGADYSVGVQVTDEKGSVLVELPQANFGGIPDFAKTPDAYTLATDGDRKVTSEQSLAAGSPLESVPEPGMGALKLTYKTDKGWKFWRVVPSDELRPIAGQPKALGLWIYGDAQGESPRLRFVDSTGQTFQPSGESITWKGWKYVTIPMDAASIGASHWGGANDGEIHYPIKWDTLFLLDRDAARPAEGTIYIAGPTLERQASQP